VSDKCINRIIRLFSPSVPANAPPGRSTRWICEHLILQRWPWQMVKHRERCRRRKSGVRKGQLRRIALNNPHTGLLKRPPRHEAKPRSSSSAVRHPVRRCNRSVVRPGPGPNSSRSSRKRRGEAPQCTLRNGQPVQDRPLRADILGEDPKPGILSGNRRIVAGVSYGSGILSVQSGRIYSSPDWLSKRTPFELFQVRWNTNNYYGQYGLSAMKSLAGMIWKYKRRKSTKIGGHRL
jgi:hypothetical protein